ncbi:hypothetical protein D3C77_553220 [compost metagenome]
MARCASGWQSSAAVGWGITTNGCGNLPWARRQALNCWRPTWPFVTPGAPWASWTWCCATATVCTTWNWPSNCTWARSTPGTTPPPGWGRAAMTDWEANWRTWRDTSCPCRRGRTAARCWPGWGWSRCRRMCGWVAICSTRGLGMRSHHRAPTRSTCAGAGCGGGTGSWAKVSDGSRCNGMPGWRRRGSRRRSAGRWSSLRRGCTCWSGRLRRSCW